MTKPQSKPLFPLKQPEEIKVQFTVRLLHGRSVVLVHVFRQPSAEDKKEFHRLQSFTSREGKEFKVVDNRREACEKLWDDCIKKIEGYDAEDVKNWKAAVPIEHKEIAVNLLLTEAGILEDVLLKNL